ncbi:unnamed protein product [Somion occarium]
MANGTYEVFILMEFCPGGGIIDMMNRRLRERLTEQEILTIFVDVCEGLAAMHALKPPLLHRDLKVENILQASETSFKLCDFGSATPVQKVPSNTQEIRMLEADLNRHTTLQYRAPEMVDVYLRRPIDEKSDVWALGVLLYKLCYYTTPFEEHGPLAILNVQYKIPPYPVYSQQMNSLIASMLREHGTQRPSVFEVLNHVHTLRGTKSRCSYQLPSKQPPLSPRALAPGPLQALSPNVMSPPSPRTNPLDDLVFYKSRQPSLSPARNAGVEAREKVLDAIAPMRRGRPASAVISTPPSSPRKERNVAPLGTHMKFGTDGDRAWHGVRGHKSGMATFGGGANLNASNHDAWGLSGREKDRDQRDGKSEEKAKGFDNDFASFGRGFGDSFQPAKSPLPPPSPKIPQSQNQSHPQTQPTSIPRPTPSPSKPAPSPHPQSKDAFEGLGLTSPPPPPTLGEARRVRTGVATLGAPASSDASNRSGRSASNYLNAPSTGQVLGIGTSNTTYRPPSSHSPMPSASSKPARSASPQVEAWKPHGNLSASSSRSFGEMSVEERFPSLEDLDREFTSPLVTPHGKEKSIHVPSQPSSTERIGEKHLPARPLSRGPGGGLRTGNLPGINGTTAGTTPATSSNRFNGVKSQQVTGAAMRESRMASSRQPTANYSQGDYLSGGRDVPTSPSRPQLTRRHRSSISIKPTQRAPPPEATLISTSAQLSPPALPPRPSASPRQESRDWLTGASDDEASSKSQPVLRESPSKRASFIEKSPVMIQKPLEAVTGSQDWPTSQDLEKQIEQQREKERMKEQERAKERERQRHREHERERDRVKELEHQKGREKNRSRAASTKSTKAFVTRTGTGTQPSDRSLQLPRVDTNAAQRSSAGSSPSGLTSNWSPIESTSRPPSPAKRGSTSSSSDDGPEDLNGFVPKGGIRQKVKEHDEVRKGHITTTPLKEEPARRRRSKGRQSSVHDLVDLWGGGVDKDAKVPRSTSPDKRSMIIMPSSTSKPRSSSPQPLISTATSDESPLATTTSRFMPPRPPSSQQHRRAPSTKPTPNARALPAPIPTASSGRARPQSMIVSPRSAPLESKANAPTRGSLSSSVSAQQQTLSPPAPDARSRRSARRSSISDMVQRYEAIGGRPGPGPPAPAAKPAGLSVKVASTGVGGSTGGATSTDTGLSSPASAASRFPRLSPTSSPVLSKASLAVPDDSDHGQAITPAAIPVPSQKDVLSRGRASPAPSLSGLPTRGSASSSFMKNPDIHAAAVNGLPRGASPLQISRPSPGITSQEPVPASPTRKVVTPPEEPRSPSPEKPYQGVSKLIDRWQRAVEESGEIGVGKGAGPKRGSLSGRGR